ncbi:hypothetical protein AAZV13_19G004000 [Glycine max]
MSVLIVTSLGDLVVDLHTNKCPLTCKNFLKLCKIKYYNGCLFHTVQKDFTAQTGDPTGTGTGGDSVYKFLYGDQARFFSDEIHIDLKHSKTGTVAMASAGENLNASQFYITLRDDLDYLDGKHTVFGEVAEGFETLTRINEAYVDEKGRPYKNIRIKHTYILEDPYEDPSQLSVFIPDASPEGKPKDEVDDEVRLEDDWVPMDEQLNPAELEEVIRSKEAHSRAVVLESIGDIPDAEIKPPDNVLFVCKLNPVTEDDNAQRGGDNARYEMVFDGDNSQSPRRDIKHQWHDGDLVERKDHRSRREQDMVDSNNRDRYGDRSRGHGGNGDNKARSERGARDLGSHADTKDRDRHMGRHGDDDYKRKDECDSRKRDEDDGYKRKDEQDSRKRDEDDGYRERRTSRDDRRNMDSSHLERRNDRDYRKRPEDSGKQEMKMDSGRRKGSPVDEDYKNGRDDEDYKHRREERGHKRQDTKADDDYKRRREDVDYKRRREDGDYRHRRQERGHKRQDIVSDDYPHRRHHGDRR